MDEETKHLKLIDLGSSRQSSTISVRVSKFANDNFSAPELLRGHGDPLTVDIYSLGLILFYMLYFEFPDEIQHIIERDFRPDSKFSNEIQDLLPMIL